LYTSGRDSVTIVTRPLRVTLENFKSMFAPILIFCGEEYWPYISVRPPSDTIQIRKRGARAKRYPLA
jgi:hypothetical protein